MVRTPPTGGRPDPAPADAAAGAVAPSSTFLRMSAAVAAASAFGLLAVLLGQGNSWDLRNYHLYDGWAFWTGRGALDFAAAQAQTYFNPLLATATYLLFTGTPPWLSAFVLGALQGANVVPLYVIARRLLPAPSAANYRLPFWTAVAGALGTTQLGELGTSIGDNIVSLPVLCAFAILFARQRPSMWRSLLAGLLVGLATGIKLTAAPFAIGLLLAVALLAWDQPSRWRIMAAGALAGAAGFLAVDGFWMINLYRQFGNPLHPVFANLFGGEYASAVPMRDTRFLPRSVLEWLLYPLVWVISPRRVSNSWFFDLRVPLAYLAIAVLLLRADANQRQSRALAVALAAAYAIWLALFGVYRYLAPLEMLAPLLVVLALFSLSARGAWYAATLCAMVVLIRPPGWGRLHEYSPAFLEVAVPDVPRLAQATVVLAEDQPLAFLALGFPPTTRFIRVGGNLLGPPYPAYAMDRDAARHLAAVEGPLYALLADPRSPAAVAALERQHLILDQDCAAVRSNLLSGNRRAELCRLRREDNRPPAT